MNKKIVAYDGLKTDDIVSILTSSSLKTSIDIRDRSCYFQGPEE